MSGKKLFIEALQEGQQVRDFFLVSRSNLAETKAGKPYLALSLMDRTGEIEARVWDNAAAFAGQAEIGNYIRVQGTAKSFRDQLQLGVTFLEQVAEEEVDLADFMPAAGRPVAEMQEELAGLIASLEDTGLRELLHKIFSGAVMEQFSVAPAAKKMHHAYLGGLLEHTLSVAGLAERLSDHYPELDRDLLLSGALLHDLAKIREFSFQSLPFDYTDQGRLLGHLVIGVDMVRKAAQGIENLSTAQLDQLCHLILSHHGQHEFGAPVLPMTQEAILLHHIDDMDAKMNYTDQLRGKMSDPGYSWSDYQRPLERFLFLRPLEEKSPVESADVKRDPAQQPPTSGTTGQRSSEPGGRQKGQQSLF